MSAQAVTPYERAREAESAGHYDLAEALYLQARRPGDAGRAAWRVGRFTDAARHYLEAAMHVEAAACFHRARDTARCLDALLHTPKDGPSYRRACQLALRVASERDVLDLSLDHFVARFLSSAPRDEHDLEAFERAAKLYERHGMSENAADVLARIVDARPQHPDAARRLERALRAAQPGALDAATASQDLAFVARPAKRATQHNVALPDLPDLPPPPPPPPPRAPVAAPATPATPAAAPAAVTPSTSGVHAVELDARALPPGALLAGRYLIGRKLGEGGMASVYAAHDNELDEDVAIKVFQSDDPQLIARFKQEVALSRKLAHPHVIRLYDLGTQGRARFLTMELLEGRSLDAHLGGPVDVATGVVLLLHACAGLGAAHAAGIVHRDIKPANFFLTRAGALKLMDFGIAKRQSASEGLTAAGFIAGTPHYMAPEQVSNFARATASSDLYSIGCMAFEMFSGAVPFDHEELMPLLMLHLREPAPLLRSRAPHVPASLEAVVASLLAKDPAARPASCEALSQSLRAVLRELGR
ncbi:MAG: serine/threonine-protein kinase [Polyangiales bacterium]